jgi:hypothetical protein
MVMWARVVRLIAAATLAATPGGAQASAVIDEATFSFTRAGTPFGTESFKIIRRLGANGVEYLVQATRTIEGKVVRTGMTIDSSGSPTAYTRVVPGQGQMTARRAMNRLTVNEEGPQASSRDYVFAPGSLILDDDVIHQLYFVTWRDPRSFGFVSPATKTTGQTALVEMGAEAVTIGRNTLPAAKYVFGEGDDRREIWIDSSRRLLKVAHPARQLIGTRDQLPR